MIFGLVEIKNVWACPFGHAHTFFIATNFLMNLGGCSLALHPFLKSLAALE